MCKQIYWEGKSFERSKERFEKLIRPKIDQPPLNKELKGTALERYYALGFYKSVFDFR